ncbi:hypothetical protein CRV09_00715 [Candidatus Pantoea edessiphila]|uniref:Uncharacterized protein n=1 Tax=Candidatus Pantoea edessiphila TaxID=2044610 RepID=A0A2P5T2L0_9GAMM|nr:hypothetical protein CRV09_00715 [Candidatus Pantoea edessiphila]
MIYRAYNFYCINSSILLFVIELKNICILKLLFELIKLIIVNKYLYKNEILFIVLNKPIK